MRLVHGELDQVVPVEQSVRMRERLTELGVAAEVVVWPGKGHAWFNFPPGLLVGAGGDGEVLGGTSRW